MGFDKSRLATCTGLLATTIERYRLVATHACTAYEGTNISAAPDICVVYVQCQGMDNTAVSE